MVHALNPLKLNNLSTQLAAEPAVFNMAEVTLFQDAGEMCGLIPAYAPPSYDTGPLNLATVFKPNLARLKADLGHPSQTYAVVHDQTASGGVHVKTGLPGSGTWTAVTQTRPTGQKAWIAGREIPILSSAPNRVLKVRRSDGPFAGQWTHVFLATANAAYALPELDLGARGYTLIVPMTAPALANGGLFGHIDFSGLYLDVIFTANGGVRVSQGGFDVAANVLTTPGGIWTANQPNLLVVTCTASKVVRVYGMSGTGFSRRPIASRTMQDMPKAEAGYVFGNVHGAKAHFETGHPAFFDYAVDAENPVLFNRLVGNYCALYGIPVVK